MTNKLFIGIFAFVLFFTAGAMAQTTSFVFQGKLNDSGIPANGSYQFTFTMYDAASGGNQIGQTITDLPATVSNGIFAVNLDFGANSFNDGAARYIEVGVRLTDTGQNYTILNPRQAVASTPYAVKSLKSEQADTAVTADNSLKLGGIAANQYVITTDSRMSDDRNPLPDSPNYIQNGMNPQASSNFNISGEGRANTFNADSQFNIGGFRAFHLNGNFNTFVGFETGNSLTSGSFNAVFGTSAGRMTTTGSNNSFFGSLAGRDNQTGSDNSFFGQAAGFRNTTGAGNSFFGYGAGVDIVGGARNTFVGFLTGQGNTNETDNTFIGYKANGAAGITNATAIGANAFAANSNTLVLGTNLVTVQVPGNLTVANTFSANALDSATVYKIAGNRVFHLTGTDNTFIGLESGNSISTGGFNAFFGAQSGKSNTNGFNNAFFGAYAGNGNIAGNNNAFFGTNAGLSNRANFNSFFGSGAGLNNFNGVSNSFFGSSSGLNNSSGQNNTFIGRSAGEIVTTGSNNTFIGASSDVLSTNAAGSNNTGIGYNTKFGAGVNNSVAIGANVSVLQSNTIEIGTLNDNTKIKGSLFSSEIRTYDLDVNGALTARLVPLGGFEVRIDGTTYAGTIISEGYGKFEGSLESSYLVQTDMPGGGNNSLCWKLTGPTDKLLATCSSSIRYKENVQNFTRGLELLRQLRPVTFNWKSDGAADVGFVAEEINQAEPLLSTFNDKGEIEGVKYAQVTTVLVNAVKEQQTQIEIRAAENQKLQEQLKQQQAQIDVLKAIVCQSNPTAAPVCAAPNEK